MFIYSIECKHQDSDKYSCIYEGNDFHDAKFIVDELIKDDDAFNWNNEYHYRIVKREIVYDAPMKV